jgi:hypothetical protein
MMEVKAEESSTENTNDFNLDENSSRKGMGKKIVSFASDTLYHEEDNIASSIIDHQYSKAIGHTQYTVAVINKLFVRSLNYFSV